MNKTYTTNEIMPDPNEVKPDAAKEFTSTKNITIAAVIGVILIALIIILAILFNM